MTLEIDPHFATGATIRYTTDGSDPTFSSTVYTGSITLTGSAVVKGKAFKSGMLDSFVNYATYTINSVSPTIEFHQVFDSGSEFLSKDYPLVKLNKVSGQTVKATMR